MEHQLIKCEGPADRDALVVILVKNGYTVRHHREKVGKSNSYKHYIEYWEEDKKA